MQGMQGRKTELNFIFWGVGGQRIARLEYCGTSQLTNF